MSTTNVPFFVDTFTQLRTPRLACIILTLDTWRGVTEISPSQVSRDLPPFSCLLTHDNNRRTSQYRSTSSVRQNTKMLSCHNILLWHLTLDEGWRRFRHRKYREIGPFFVLFDVRYYRVKTRKCVLSHVWTSSEHNICVLFDHPRPVIVFILLNLRKEASYEKLLSTLQVRPADSYSLVNSNVALCLITAP